MKHISKKGMMVVACGMLAVTSCSDFSDYNTAPVASSSAADKTLWENISQNAELSDFAAVLKRVGYDEVLSASHTYTVWAPVNGSFDMDSLANVPDAKVEKEFVRNLIADFAHSETDLNDTTIYMLNEKLLKFGNKNTASLTFDNKQILPNKTLLLPGQENASVYNYPSTNGLLYTVAAPSTFRFNGYEILSELGDVAGNLLAYVKRYEKIDLDKEKSVKGEIRDGVQHYDDSVMVTKNTLITNTLRAKLDNEDSLYTVIVPTDEAWEKVYGTISKYYNYIPTINYQDLSSTAVGQTKGGTTSATSATIMDPKLGSVATSLTDAPEDAEIQETAAYWTDSLAKSIIVENLIYSETNKKYNAKLSTGAPFAEKDTLCSTTRNYLTDLAKLDAATVEVKDLSNGHARIINEYPFDPETYLPEVRTRNISRIVTAAGSSYKSVAMINVPSIVWQPEDEETRLLYVKTDVPDNSTYAPELDFYLNGVRSATYDIYAVLVPPSIESENADNFKPYTLRFDINYTDADNKPIAGRFDGTGIQTTAAGLRSVKAFEVKCSQEIQIDGELRTIPKVDTLKLGRVTFPICYYGTDARPNIKVMHTVASFLSSTKRQYEQNIRIANIILKPVYENDEENATKED